MTEQQLYEKYGEEKVMVVESRNFTKDDTIYDYMEKIQFYGVFLPRYQMERDLNYRQIIPYVVLKCDDKYFVAKRLGGDERLVGGCSLGQGGHINPVDRFAVEGRRVIPEYIVKECIYREMVEETTMDLSAGRPDIEFKDVFIDDSTDVSRVHACILCVMEINEEIEVKETDKLEGMWLTEKEITNEIFDTFENWSRIAYQKLFGRDVPVGKKKRTPRRKKDESVEE